MLFFYQWAEIAINSSYCTEKNKSCGLSGGCYTEMLLVSLDPALK